MPRAEENAQLSERASRNRDPWNCAPAPASVRRLLFLTSLLVPSAFCLLFAVCCFLPPAFSFPQEAPPASPPDAVAEVEELPLASDWAPQLLDRIVSSPNIEARDALLRAAFAAGPGLVPQLEAALRDDRTAEFAAQALAYIGGEKALSILARLVDDPRDLDLRRFSYGALAEFDAPGANETLLAVIGHADEEPDRTVTETAIVALTVRSDPKLLAPLREVGAKVQDIVIKLDLENAIAVIEGRATFLASPDAKKAGGSIDAAVRTYFLLGIKPPLELAASGSPPGRPTPPPPPKVEIQNLTLSPDKTRALARVTFEDPTATATYDIVLQKRFGDWTLASVWLGEQFEKPSPTTPPPRPTRRKPSPAKPPTGP